MTVAQQISRNWKSGLTVALVSVPLSIALAIAGGATPVMGILTAVWAGIVAALLGGSEYNVVGPAGAFSGILAAFALTVGVQYMPLLALATGALIFLCYLLKWEKYLVFIPSSVMHGFTLGVGLTIGLSQLNSALGLSGLPVHESALLNIRESLLHVGQLSPATALLFAALLLLLFVLANMCPALPGPIPVALIGIAVGYASDHGMLPFSVTTLLSKYGPLQASLAQLPQFSLPPSLPAFAKAAMTLAVVGVLETLLSAKIVDTMTGTRFNQRREVFGLAWANVASGLAGGLPATGVLVRTALNAKMGALSRWSSGLNALFVLLIALLLFPVFQYLPLAAVAAILVFASVRMVEVHHFKKMFVFDQSSFWLSMVVGALTFAVDPMIGLLVGATVALLEFAQHLSKGQSELTLHKDKKLVARIPHHRIHEYKDSVDVVVYRFAGELTYFNGPSHEDAIKKLSADTLIFSLRNLFYIDLDGVTVLQEIIKHCKQAGKTVILTGAGEYILPLLEKVSWFRQEEQDGRVFSSTTEALKSLGFVLA
jgi:SulP family sulfate permease